jgi:hypothetical protein
VSAKQTDNSWAVKSNVPYKSLIGSKGPGEIDTDSASESKSRPDSGAFSGSVSGRSSLASDTLTEGDETKEENEVAVPTKQELKVEEKHKEVAAEVVAARSAVVTKTENSGKAAAASASGSTPQDPSPKVASTAVAEQVAANIVKLSPQITSATADSYVLDLLKLIQSLQDMATVADRKGWYYLNHEGGEEGPFASDWMHSWLADRALNRDTQIRFGEGRNFFALSSLVPNCDTITAESPNPFIYEVAKDVQRVKEIIGKMPI